MSALADFDDTWELYQPGGTAFNQLWGQYGQDVAYAAANAAYEGDRIALSNIIANARDFKSANPGGTSTLGNLWTQVTTNPLAAPLDGANNVIKNSFLSLLTNPWVLVTLAALVFFVVFDGLSILRKKLA